jgi:hypothetical protein
MIAKPPTIEIEKNSENSESESPNSLSTGKRVRYVPLAAIPNRDMLITRNAK